MSNLEYMRQWREKNREKLREYNLNYQREWRDRNREKVRENAIAAYYRHHEKKKEAARYRARFTRYGITKSDYERMLAQQGGGCAICGVKPPADRPLCVDHCHSTGEVRGILCDRCNTRLQAIEDVEYRNSADAYLAKYRRKVVVPSEFKDCGR